MIWYWYYRIGLHSNGTCCVDLSRKCLCYTKIRLCQSSFIWTAAFLKLLFFSLPVFSATYWRLNPNSICLAHIHLHIVSAIRITGEKFFVVAYGTACNTNINNTMMAVVVILRGLPLNHDDAL